MSKIKQDFYLQEDVVQISKDLLGKYLFTKFNGKITAGIIIETEAYAGITDKASHAYSNRRTKRTEIMFAKGGIAYVYLCYGIHHLFNIVTNQKDIPHAVLIRAVKPIIGIDTIVKRRNQNKVNSKISSGPGTVSQALGIRTNHNGLDLTKNKIWLEDDGVKVIEKNITASKRIGIDYAGEDAKLLYRFTINL